MKKRKGFVKGIVSAAAALCMLIPSPAAMSAVTADAAAAVYGDVNNDGVVDIGDVIVLSKFLNGGLPASSINMKYADVDKNTVFDVNDCQTILAYLIGNVKQLPYSESGSTFNYYNYTMPADQTRNYIKYDCSTRSQSTYTLNKASSVSVTSGDNDDRIIDSSDNAQCIVRLDYKKNDGNSYRATGFIVSDHVIATAAHCVYFGSTFNTNYTVTIYDTAGTSPIATYSASEIHIPSAYANPTLVNEDNNDNYDYALIYVEEDLSAYGNMALGVVSNYFPGTSQRVYASGFPGIAHEAETTYRYYSVGNITSQVPNPIPSSASAYRLFHTAYCSKGDSGGPMYIEYTLNGSTFRSAIGITSAGHESDSIQGAIRITLPLLRFYTNNPNIG